MKTKLYWAGWVIGTLPMLLLLFSASMKFMQPPELKEGMAHLGLPENLVLPLGILETSCALIYLFPRTAVLGAILVTGYMGGAMLAHLRIGEPVHMHVLIGVLAWLGLFLRDERLRALLPVVR